MYKEYISKAWSLRDIFTSCTCTLLQTFITRTKTWPSRALKLTRNLGVTESETTNVITSTKSDHTIDSLLEWNVLSGSGFYLVYSDRYFQPFKSCPMGKMGNLG